MWEYEVVEYDDYDGIGHPTSEDLNDLGKDGWELIDVEYKLRSEISVCKCIFKRQCTK
jgi:hypothetical protein